MGVVIYKNFKKHTPRWFLHPIFTFDALIASPVILYSVVPWSCRSTSKTPVIEPMLDKKLKLRRTRIKAAAFGDWKPNLKSI